jgi:signal transduction protein with GAF and PtsI domain
MDCRSLLVGTQPGRTAMPPPDALLEVAPSEPKARHLSVDEIRALASQKRPPHETLNDIVQLIRRHTDAKVCSVYLLEPDRATLVLGATVGLRPDSVGRVRMRLDEGLVGLAAEQLRPVMVEDAPRHPRFKYFRETGEDAYRSFLGVPLVDDGMIQGVLVVQTVEARVFSREEIATLSAAAHQLGPIVSEARTRNPA